MDPQKFFKTLESVNDLTPHLNPLTPHLMNKLTPEELWTAFYQALYSQWEIDARDTGTLKNRTKF